MVRYREIEFEIPFHIPAPDGFENPKAEFYPRVSQNPVGLKFQSKTPGSLSDIGGTATVRRDRLGNTVRSKVRTKFHSKFEEVIPNDAPNEGFHPVGKLTRDRNGYYIKASVLALNEFIEIFREESGHYWMRLLEPGDIGEFEIRDLDDGDLVNSTTRGVTPGGLTLGGLTTEDFENLAKKLETGYQTNLYQSLHLDVIDRIDQNECEIAIMLSYQLFERWVKNGFVKMLSSKGKSKEEAENLIKKDDGRYISLSNLLINYMEHHADIDFQSSSIYDTWDENLRTERNDVVHGDYQSDHNSALEAHRTTIETINWFQNQFGDHINKEPESIEFVNVRELREDN